MNKIYPILLSCLLLSACGSTYEGLKSDFSILRENVAGTWQNVSSKTAQTYKNLSDKAANFNKEQSIVDGSECLAVMIDPQLKRATEFFDMGNPSADQITSTVEITQASHFCSAKDNALTMELSLTFVSELGPKARRKEGDTPFFAYPYFIAIKDIMGRELARETFAVSAAYNNGQGDRLTLKETIRQTIPLTDAGQIPDYRVHVGFELTPEQLAYNASF